MRARRRIVATSLLACALMSPHPARAEDAAVSPVQLVANLQNIQGGDRARRSGRLCRAAQAAARYFRSVFGAAKPEVWRNPRNARAAVIYLLSGGQPRVIMRLIESGNVPKDEEKMMRGALAYVLSHEAEALKLLGDVDPKSLDPALGGQLAFVQSMLLTTIDPQEGGRASRSGPAADAGRAGRGGGAAARSFSGRRHGARRRTNSWRWRAISEPLSQISLMPTISCGVSSATLIRLRLAEDVDNFPKTRSDDGKSWPRRPPRALSDHRARRAGERQDRHGRRRREQSA